MKVKIEEEKHEIDLNKSISWQIMKGMFVNGLFSGARTSTDNFTAYINPYLVVSKAGNYTKHIYMGSQRIVSKLGDLDSYGQDPRRIAYAGSDVDGASVDFAGKYTQSQQTIKDRYADFEVPYNGKDNDDYVNGSGFCCDDNPSLRAGAIGAGNDNPETFQYYYHSDHLGSASLITNLDGEVVQHVEYVPFGEVFIEERNNKWNTPYLFNAKELDEETGLYYYGARYYDSRTSVWLSTDPLQEKYPNISTYVYCLNNPVNAVDLQGDSTTILNLGTGTNQHMAILIQNDADKWEYFSINGDNVFSSGKHKGGREFNDVPAVDENGNPLQFDSPQQFIDSYYNQEGDKGDKSINSYGYTEGYVIPTTPEQDNIIRNTFINISNTEEYRLNPLNPNQCATITQKSLNAAGIETRSITYIKTGLNSGYFEKTNPYLPSSAYHAIMKNNPKGFSILKSNR
jgi:RHS repeat-associated protein